MCSNGLVPVNFVFLGVINEFSDLCNGSHSMQSVHARKPLLAAYTTKNDFRLKHMFGDIITYFRDWQKEVSVLPNKTPEEKKKMLPSEQTLIGIEMTCLSVKAAIEFLLDEGQKYVYSRIFCQDPIEQHFSHQRAALGSNQNPTAEQYARNANSLHLRGNLGFKRKRANTEDVSRLTKEDCTPLAKRPRMPICRSIVPQFE